MADRDTDAGRFINMWSEMPDDGTGENYNVDWEKGLVSGLRTLEDTGNKAQRQRLDRAMFGGEKEKEPKQKKVQMKIGKWLAKVHDLATKRQEIIQLFWKSSTNSTLKANDPMKAARLTSPGSPPARSRN